MKFSNFIEKYTTSSGVDCVCYMYIAIDMGVSDNDSEDTHDTYWIPFDKVEAKLSYDNLKKIWREVKDNIEKVVKVEMNTLHTN